jgi:hypothetical protein
MRPYLALQRAASLLLFAIMIVSFVAIGISAAVDKGSIQLPEVEGGPVLSDYVDLTEDGLIDMTSPGWEEGLKKFNVDNYNYYVENGLDTGIEQPDTNLPVTEEFVKEHLGSLTDDLTDFISSSAVTISQGIVNKTEEVKTYVGEKIDGVFTSLADKTEEIKTYVGERLSSVFDGLGGKIGQFVLDIFFPGQKDLVDLIKDGGVSHVSSDFNKAISSIYDLFMPLGCFIMVISWLFGVAKSAVTLNLDIQGKEGIIRSGINLIVGVMLFEISMEAMEAMSGLCWEYCSSISTEVTQTILPKDLSSFFAPELSGIGTPLTRELGYALISWITEAVLLLNLAYMGLLQCISPVFIGFAAGGEGSRRFVAGFFKEYFKICLIPPVIAIYVTLCFVLFKSSGLGLFLGIVLGASIFSIGKKLDRIVG